MIYLKAAIYSAGLLIIFLLILMLRSAEEELAAWRILALQRRDEVNICKEVLTDAGRLVLALDLEEQQDYWMEELARQAKDVALSKLQQLFIAV